VGECFFWYRPTRVVPDQRPLNGRCCCCSRCGLRTGAIGNLSADGNIPSTSRKKKPAVRKRSAVMNLTVCLCVCVSVSLSANISELQVRSSSHFMHVTHRRCSVLLRRRSDTLSTSGPIDDVTFAYLSIKLITFKF